MTTTTVDLATGRAVRCRGQLVAIDPGAYDWIVLRLAGPVADEEEHTVWLHYRGGVDPEWMRLTAAATSCRIPVPRHDILVAVRLPDRPGVRVLGLTPIPTSWKVSEHG